MSSKQAIVGNSDVAVFARFSGDPGEGPPVPGWWGSQRPQKLAVKALESGDSPRVEGMNTGHVEQLAELDSALPPIVVHRSTMQVIDGMHRLHAAALRGDEFIDVLFFEGSEADAFVLAVELNHAHGLPLSTADRRTAATRIIGSHPEWSDRRIAAVTGLAASTVGAIRTRSTERIEQPNVRIGRDGRVRRRDGAEGRRLAGKLIAAKPNASLREIAEAAGISPATAGDVRARVARGEPPVTPRQRRASEATGGCSSRPGALPAEVVDSLKRDPSLRFTDAGRLLLRFLDCCAVEPHQWDEIIRSVPLHQRSMVVHLAREASTTWQGFADRLERQADGTLPS